MAIQNELERYEEWRETFVLSEEGPHTFRQLEKLRKIDNIVWNSDDSSKDKIDQISVVLTS